MPGVLTAWSVRGGLRKAPPLPMDQPLMHAAMSYEESSNFINTPGKKFPTFHAFLVRTPCR
jgi:hypothetical protein